MTSGNFVNIPAHKKYRVEWTTSEDLVGKAAVHWSPHRLPEDGRGLGEGDWYVIAAIIDEELAGESQSLVESAPTPTG